MNRSESSSTGTEAGSTLMEVVVAVLVLGTSFVAFVGGMGTSILSSDIHRDQAVAETAIRRYAEAVKQVPCPGVCPPVYTAAGVGFTAPTGFTAADPTVECFDADNNPTICPSLGVQRVTVSVASDDGQVSTQVELVKRPD